MKISQQMDSFFSAAAILVLFIPCVSLLAAENFDDLYDRACLRFSMGDYENALKFYKKANSLKKETDLECLYGIAQSYQKLRAFNKARNIC
jgi:tetratricopeptide (TPR) repeat protein